MPALGSSWESLNAALYAVVCLRALFLLPRAGGAVKGGGGGVEVGDTEPLKGLRDVREPCGASTGSLIASGSKERSDEGLKTAST
jgi:hypothetical protein